MENQSNVVPEDDAKSVEEKETTNKKERALRTKQLRRVRTVIKQLDERARAAHHENKRREALLSHLQAFYSELSKIAKGKGMNLVPVPELMVTQINDAIADAKKIIATDIYLDRVKQFVPAGNPPTYPEVLLISKTVEEILTRHAHDFGAKSRAIQRKLNEAYTVQAGLQCAIEEIEYAVSRDSVEERIDVLDDSWFIADDSGDEVFDLDRLDTLDFESHLLALDDVGCESDDEQGDEDDSDADEDDE